LSSGNSFERRHHRLGLTEEDFGASEHVGIQIVNMTLLRTRGHEVADSLSLGDTLGELGADLASGLFPVDLDARQGRLHGESSCSV
jgi:hypothetical protein